MDVIACEEELALNNKGPSEQGIDLLTCLPVFPVVHLAKLAAFPVALPEVS